MFDLDLMAYLIIAVAFLFLLVLYLCLAIHEINGAIKLSGSLLGDRIERVRDEMQWLQNRLVEVEHCVDLEKDPLPFRPSTTER